MPMTVLRMIRQLEPDAILGLGDPDTSGAIAAITAAELLYGVYKSSGPRRVGTERAGRALPSAPTT